MSNESVPKLQRCKHCQQSQVPSEFTWGYHFEPGAAHGWCRTCQFKAVSAR